MATVQTLKDKNNDTFYPVTKTEAVYNADGSESLDTTIVNVGNVLATKATVSDDVADTNKMMKADGTKSLVNTANIANSAVTSSNIDFTTLGKRTLNYYSTSNTTIESATYSALTSSSITTHGGGLLIFGYVYGTVTAGIAYLYARVDNTEYRLGQINNAATNLQGIYYVPTLTAGSHTVSFGVTRQDGAGRSFTIPGYCINQVQFIEC